MSWTSSTMSSNSSSYSFFKYWKYKYQQHIDYSCITFAEFFFCTSIPETLSISLKAAKEIRIFFVFRKLIRTFLIQKKLRTGYAQKYFDKTRNISHSSSFSQLKFYAQRLREHAQMYLNCSL